jgi:hypothetical protein
MQSAIGRQQQLKKLGVDTAPLYAVRAKSAAIVMILVGIALIGATAPAKQSGMLAVSGPERVNEKREAMLLNCRPESDAVKARVNVATRCPIAIGGLAAATASVARGESTNP